MPLCRALTRRRSRYAAWILAISACAVHTASYAAIPFSNLASPALERNEREKEASGQRYRDALKAAGVDFRKQPAEFRRILDETYFLPGVQRLRKAFDVKIERGAMGGVPVDIVTPSAGVAPANRNRVLINPPTVVIGIASCWPL